MKSLLALLTMAAAFLSGPAAAAPVTEDEAYTIGIEAYTYAYPLVLMETTRRVSTNTGAPGRMRAPVNQFGNMKTYPDATFKDVVRPNADTLYSSMWFDVGKEPLVLTLPNTQGRYHVIPLMDMWTDVFATLGTRTTGNDGGLAAIVGPNWKGTLPKGMRLVRSPTDMGWIIGRIQTNGAADYDHVHALQAGLKATPLSRWGKPEVAAAAPTPDASVDMKTPPVQQVAQMAPQAFFASFAELMKRNPPHASDYSIVLRMERLGIVQGQSFDLSKADPAVQRGLIRAAADAYQRIVTRRKALPIRSGWGAIGSTVGVYGNDYLARAFIGFAGLGALPPEEAIYPMAALGDDGKPLTGASNYVLHFEKDQIPPADAFWSLTMYGEDQFFVANPINRFAIGDRDKLKFNADGSLDLYIQTISPGADKEANWLPAPAGPFTMNLRLYLPQRRATDGSWTPPPVKRVP